MKGYIPDANSLAVESTGYRIKYYRLRAGMTQKQLATACGLNESTIRNYELNNRTPDLDTLTAIAKALKVNIFALAAPDPAAVNGALHILIDLEKIYGLHPETIDGKVCLVAKKGNPDDIQAALLNRGIKEWASVSEANQSGDLDDDAYLEWQAKYSAI